MRYIGLTQTPIVPRNQKAPFMGRRNLALWLQPRAAPMINGGDNTGIQNEAHRVDTNTPCPKVPKKPHLWGVAI